MWQITPRASGTLRPLAHPLPIEVLTMEKQEELERAVAAAWFALIAAERAGAETAICDACCRVYLAAVEALNVHNARQTQAAMPRGA